MINACAESSTFLCLLSASRRVRVRAATHTIIRKLSFSSLEYPSWWMIFICLTMVDLPDSPEPVVSEPSLSDPPPPGELTEQQDLALLFELS